MSRRTLILLGAGAAALAMLMVCGLAGLAFFILRREAPVAEQLLLVGPDGRLSLLDAEQRARTLAENASADPFRYPVPAPDGRSLAVIEAAGQGASALVVLSIADGARRELYRSGDSPPLYLSWSPDGRYLAFLVNAGEGGLRTYVVPSDGSREAELISPASPSYFVWSPDSSTLLLHQGGAGVEGGRVLSYRPGEGPRSLFNDPGLFFRTVDWSRDGSQIYYVAQPAVEGELREEDIESVITRARADGSAPEALVREQRALLFFLRAPSSEQIAYIKLSAEERALYLWDPAAPTPRRLSLPDEVVSEFFWSPDGSRIAYLTLEQSSSSAQSINRRWHIVELSGGEPRAFETFAPSPSFEALLSFFDAYALSLDIWSADSRRIVYGAADGVYVLDTASGQATRVGEGALGMWVRAR